MRVMALRAGVLVLFCTAAQAQGPVIARGRLLESDTGETGELSVRTQTDHVYWYVYDAKTYVEADHKPTSVARLNKGDQIEIVSDAGPDAALRYARIIHVLESPKPHALAARPASLGRYAMPRHPVERDDPLQVDMLLSRGTLTFAGQVCQLNDERFVLRTRTDGEKTIYLRPDTRFMKDGGVAPASALRLNTRVFVRGSKNLEGEIEAFQVIWSEIPEPR